MTTSEAAIAAFLAKGGKVQKVADNATCGMTARDFYNAARASSSDVSADQLAERAMERAREENGYYKS